MKLLDVICDTAFFGALARSASGQNKELYRGFDVWPETISAGGTTEARQQSSNISRRL